MAGKDVEVGGGGGGVLTMTAFFSESNIFPVQADDNTCLSSGGVCLAKVH